MIIHSRLFRCVGIAILHIPITSQSSVCGDDVAEERSLDIDSVIAAISAMEERVEAFAFSCELWKGTFVENENRGWELLSTAPSDDESPTAVYLIHSNSDVLYSAQNGKYKATREVLTRTQMDGDTPELRVRYVSHRDTFSNDGVSFLMQSYGTATRTRPDPNDSREAWDRAEEWKAAGVVGESIDEPLYLENKSFLHLHGFNLGIGHVTPYVSPELEPPQKLSTLLRSKADAGDFIEARVTPQGMWEILYTIKESVSPPYSFAVLYDAEIGRIVRCEKRRCKVCQQYTWDDSYPYGVTEYRYADDDALIPDVVTSVNLTGRPVEVDGKIVRQGLRWVYSNRQLNPPTADGDFIFTFDKGVEVVDYVDERLYVVGGGLEQDQESVDRFLKHHGLTEGATAIERVPALGSRSTRFWLVAVANLLVLALVIAIIVYQRRRAATLAFLAALSPLQASANVHDSSRPHERQCGHSVTMAVLRMYGIDYSLNVVEAELTPSEDGVSLGQISRLLQAYGLQTDARKGLQVSDLESVCQQGLVAIVPIVVETGRNHYILVLQRRSALTVVDVLRSVRPLAEVKLDGQMAAAGGFVLFVHPMQRSRDNDDDRDVIRFVPDHVDLGRFAIDGDSRYSPLEVEITLHNTTDQPVVLEDIGASCGCVTLKRSVAIIDSNGSVRLPIEISRTGWGHGPSVRMIQARLNRERSALLRLTGEGVAEATIKQGLTIDRNVITQCAGDAIYSSGTVRELQLPSITVSADPSILAQLQVSASDEWIKAHIIPVDGSRSRIECQVDINDDMRERLKATGKVAGALHVFATDDEPVICKVLLARQTLFQLYPNPAQLDPSVDRLELSLKPLDGASGDAKIKLLSVTPLESLTCEAESSEGGPQLIRVSRNKNTRKGASIIRAVVDSKFGEEAIYATVIVR